MKYFRNSLYISALFVGSAAYPESDITEIWASESDFFFDASQVLGCEPPLPSIHVYDSAKEQFLGVDEMVSLFPAISEMAPTGDRECSGMATNERFASVFAEPTADRVAVYVELAVANDNLLSGLSDEVRQRVEDRRENLYAAFQGMDVKQKVVVRQSP